MIIVNLDSSVWLLLKSSFFVFAENRWDYRELWTFFFVVNTATTVIRCSFVALLICLTVHKHLLKILLFSFLINNPLQFFSSLHCYWQYVQTDNPSYLFRTRTQGMAGYVAGMYLCSG
jgi:hypothetical protein